MAAAGSAPCSLHSTSDKHLVQAELPLYPVIQGMSEQAKEQRAPSDEPPPRKRKRPRLRTILLVVNLVILLLPLAGIGILRVYESELVRVTETSLIAQGALIGAAYREFLLRELRNPRGNQPAIEVSEYGVPLHPRLRYLHDVNRPVRAIPPRLDLATEPIRPPAPDAVLPEASPDAYAVMAGRSISPMLRSARGVTLSAIRVTDCNGIVVASSGADLGLSLIDREEILGALGGRPVSLLRERIPEEPTPALESISRGGRKRVFVAMPVVAEDRIVGAVALSRTPLDIAKALYLNRYHLLTGGAVILAAVLIVSLFTALMISRPVEQLIGQSERITRGEKGAAVPLENPRMFEVDKLSRAFAKMAETLEKRAEYIRAFASSVSHGFKTPLTSMRGAVELLEDHFDDMSPSDRNRFLKIIDEETARLERLVARLLELARAETLTPGSGTTRVTPALKGLVGHYSETGMKISLESRAADALVHLNPETFESILSNLLDNARLHGGADVSVSIDSRLTEDETGRWVELSVSDEGTGISEANAAKVFDPFFTTAGDAGGSGLGLPIVKALVEAHGGSIALVQAERGCRFQLKLPV